MWFQSMPPHTVATKATIWLSRRCQCIYKNLALEDWIFRNHAFTDHDGLLIWRNRSAAVIGKHQNPWTELDVGYASKCGADVARRQSGGGAVYHDLGNVNICVFTNKSRHRRDENLRMLAKVLNDKWNVNAGVSKRHDLLLDGKYKISGTAAKLTHDKAYHHFTLLLDVDIDHLWSILTPSMLGIASKATASIRSEVKTLSHVIKGIRYDEIVESIIDEFRSRYETTNLLEIDSITDADFDNIESIIQEFSSWQWIYGMTPPFSVSKSLDESLVLRVHVEKGVISKFSIDNASDCDLERILNKSEYIGCKFDPILCRRIFDCV